MTELWLVRHGETEWSLSGAHTSFTDIPLTEHGRERARELKAYLADTKFTAVLVSPLKRAQETARLAGYGDIMQTVPELTEWNYGEAEGKSTKQMREELGKPNWSVWTDPVEAIGGESVQAVGIRADRVIAKALAAADEMGKADPSGALPGTEQAGIDGGRQKQAGSGSGEQTLGVAKQQGTQRVALFAHAHILRILASRWIGLPAVEGRLFALGTGSVSVLGFERETRVIAHWNREFEGE